MKQSAVGEITINDCSECRGMWFDQGELGDVKDEVFPDLGWLDVDAWMGQTEIQIQRSPLLCPRCADNELTTIQDQQSLTEMDTCTQCNGTWLNAGQFLYIINALLDDANKKTAPEFLKISLQKAKEMLTDGDSITSDWADLKSVLTFLKHRIFF
jgi:Zn-finger nucleic acid-binding protein